MGKFFITCLSIFLLGIFLTGCTSNGDHPASQNHTDGGSGSSASWAYVFVKWQGQTYVMLGKP